MGKLKKRNSNLELLRIFSMFFIVLHHFAYHGSTWAWQYNRLYWHADKVYLFLACLGKAAVVSFVMIGAYFLSKKKFKLWRVVQLCITTLVYSWLIFLFLHWKFPGLLKGATTSNIWLPIPIPSNYWFVIAYVYMLLFMPFMNLILEKTSRRQILTILVVFTLLWTILQFINVIKPDNDQYNFFNFNNYFLLIYLISGYIRKYRPKWSVGFIRAFLSLAITLLVIWGIIYSISPKEYNWFAGVMASLSNPLSLILGVTVFTFFNSINMGHSVIINYISKSMFGVYLIHDNSYVRPIIWQKLVNTLPYAKNPGKYLQFGLEVSLTIFAICVGIDIVKRILIDPITNYLGMKATNSFVKWSSKANNS